MRQTAIIMLLIAGAAAAPVADAHPHMFIDSRVTFRFSSTALEGFWIDWLFDEMFTAMIVMDYDSNRNGKLETEEVRAIEQGAFSNLIHYNYFTTVLHGGATRRINEVRDFSASIQSGRLTYRFFVPFRANLSSSEQVLQVMIYDESFFCDIAFKENEPVRVSAPGTVVSEYRIQRNRDRKIVYDAFDTTGAREDIDYTGTVHPFEVRLSFKRR